MNTNMSEYENVKAHTNAIDAERQEPVYRTHNWQGIEEQKALDAFMSGESERPLYVPFGLMLYAPVIHINSQTMHSLSGPYSCVQSCRSSTMMDYALSMVLIPNSV